MGRWDVYPWLSTIRYGEEEDAEVLQCGTDLPSKSLDWPFNLVFIMQKFFYFLSFGCVIVIGMMEAPTYAQSDEADVRAVIDRLFDGMRAGDSTMVRSVLHDEALMARAGSQGLRIGPADGFVRAVGTPHDEIWDERIWNIQISVDGRLASAWMEFAFFLGDRLSHCGVNSMQFYRTDEGWKIIYLADTNRPPACEVSPNGS